MRAVITRTVLWGLVAVSLLAGCSGPPAPDAAICQDVIHRLCLAPRCSAVESALNVSEDCEATLLSRTGCGAEDFAFTQPSREAFVSCRVPLLRKGNSPEQHPDCADVEEVLDHCDAVVAFLKGAQ